MSSYQKCKLFFTLPDIKYNSFNSAIDILAVNLNESIIWDIEVKFKSRITIAHNKSKEQGFEHFVSQLINNNRENKITDIIGKSDKGFKIIKTFITTKRFFTKKKFDYWVEQFKYNGINVVFFDDIINDLSTLAKNSTKENDVILQTLRLYKQFA